mgnify:CR=1 FL=1
MNQEEHTKHRKECAERGGKNAKVKAAEASKMKFDWVK